MGQSETPQTGRRNEKEAGGDRKKGVPVSDRFSGQIEKRIILKQCKRHQEGTDRKHRLSVNGDRVFSVFPCAVREYVHELQALQGEEADGGEDDIDGGKHESPSKDHEEKCERPHRSPDDTALCHSVNQHDGGLEEPSDPCQFDFAAQYQEDAAARPQQDSVKFSVSNHLVKGIETAEKCFRQSIRHQSDGKTQEYLRVGESLNLMKPFHHEGDAQKYVERDEKLPQYGEKE